MQHVVYRFGDWETDIGAWELRRQGAAIEIPGLAFSVLAMLLKNRERVVSRTELLDTIWQGVIVNDGSLTQAIWQIRHALGDGARSQRMVKTIRGRGYRFVAPVECAKHRSDGLAHAP